MRSKRVLTLVMALCLLISVVSPAAIAATTDEQIRNEQTSGTRHHLASDRVVTGANPAPSGINSLRDGGSVNTSTNNNPQGVQSGYWTVTPTEQDYSVDMGDERLPACITALEQAASTYAIDEIVPAFIVLDAAPLSEQGYASAGEVPADKLAAMEEAQNALIRKIEAEILDGEALQVRRQLTYLTNAITVNIPFGELKNIALMDGIETVFVMPVYSALTTEQTGVQPYTTESGDSVGAPNVWAELGYTGTGMKIAVIDTGLDLDHPSFAADPEMNENSLTIDDVAAVLSQLNASSGNYYSALTAEDLWRSNKVPFAFNYVDANLKADHNSDTQGDHGTHVAGIAAANRMENTEVAGMAPDAQIIVMKVFGANGGAYVDDYVAALEDAMTLGCDVANLSLGSPAGFTSIDPEIDAIFARIAEHDMIVAIAAGNEETSSYGNIWSTNLNLTSDPDNGTMSTPATFVNATSVASFENMHMLFSYFTVGEMGLAYYDATGLDVEFAELFGQELEYVMVPGLGYAEDFEGLDVEGKVAVISRGTINFSEKLANAEANGAIAVVIYNNTDDGLFGMTVLNDDDELPENVSGQVPMVSVSKKTAEYMAAAENKILVVSAQAGLIPHESGGQMSTFSSWGTTPDLRLMPDVAAIGGEVLSTVDKGRYDVMSGTSMACPQLAGLAALVLEYLHTEHAYLSDAQMRVVADSLLMSTASPRFSNISGLEFSPRQQGAGMANVLDAITSQAYLSVAGSAKPKAELGDDPDKTGTYTFTFSVHNMSSAAKTYTLSSTLMTEAFVEAYGHEFMAGYNTKLSGDVTFSASTVTVAAGSTAEVTVTIQLTEEGKQWLEAHYPNGGFVEGYVYLTCADGVDMSLPFMGFYGDWTTPPIFDTAYWYDNSFWGLPAEEPEGSEYYNIFWTDLDGTDFVLGFNPYAGALIDENYNVYYDPANNVISNNGDGYVDTLVEIQLSMMRNAKTVTFTYTDANTGEVYDSLVVDNVTKTMYRSSYGQVVPYIHSWYAYAHEFYDFTDANGDPLPNNTQLTLTITATSDYPGEQDTQGDVIEVPITIDTQAPEIIYVEEMLYEGRNMLVLYFEENVNMAGVTILNPQGTRVLTEAFSFGYQSGYYYTVVDVTGFGTEMVCIVGDYGCNENGYILTWNEGSNLPELSNGLFGYRVYDAKIGNDHMFGWVGINKETAGVTVLTDDFMEYYALTAAEYAGGYIFAVDAANNLVVMTPGLWNRTIIRNLGYVVADMTFDDVTDTMYALVKNEWGYYMLCTIDLLTGEMEMLSEFWYYDPVTIEAAADGTLYLTAVGSEGLYMLDPADYSMVPVMDAEGNPVVFMDEYGNGVYPYYAQSMTYSAEDNALYWAYYTPYGDPALVKIDLETYEYTMTPFATDSEYVGLLTLDETEYQVPATSELTDIVLTDDSLLMVVDEMAELGVSPIPWNAALGEITWTSTDESVAMVDNGYILAVGPGDCEIIASVGDIAVSCVVTVVEMNGTVYAYDYYDGANSYETWISFDMANIAAGCEYLYESPVDFVAAEYNGHDGFIYGYDAAFQLHRFNPATGETAVLGMPVTEVSVSDMAYDYSTGLMYVVALDSARECSVFYCLNMRNGALVEVATSYYMYLTLACSNDGELFGITADGYLIYANLIPADDMGGDIMPWDLDDDFGVVEGGTEMMLDEMVAMGGLGELEYMQSMTYDHNYGNLVWANPETTSIYWIDPWNGYIISCGDVSQTGIFQYVGLYTIPAEINELPYTPVENIFGEDMLMIEGTSKAVSISVEPLNATNADITWTVGDESIVSVDSMGNVSALKVGTTTITATVVDGENTLTCTIYVTVKPAGDNVYGYMLTDLSTGGGNCWIEIFDQDPSNPRYLHATNYEVYSEEYVNGKLYVYLYDPNDWQSNWQFAVIDPDTFIIESMTDLGDSFPWVYDMTYDYTTGVMYAVAGFGDTETEVYAVDMETGELVMVMRTGQFFMSIAATDKGIYVMENSVFDEWDYVYGNAKLYKIDPLAGTVDLVGDTGVKSNMLASMSYDYDTGNLYWTPVFRADYFSPASGFLAIVDIETAQVINAGPIEKAGAQVSGLYITCDEYPEKQDTSLLGVMVDNKHVMNVGEEVALTASVLPLNIEVEMTWSSSDETVATVDENGVVTAVGSGKCFITVTVKSGDVVRSATCTISVLEEEASILTWSITNNGWSAINQMDPYIVTSLTSAAEEAPVVAATYVGNHIYGYDAEGNFFVADDVNFQRTNLGEMTLERIEGEGIDFEIRDLAYDKTTGKLLALGGYTITDEWGYVYEMVDGCRIYEVDMQTGALTEVCILINQSNVRGMTITEYGVVYIYSCFDDYFRTVDLTTGACTDLSTAQRQLLYGSTEHLLAMTYDPITETIFLLHTGNGNAYRLLSLNPETLEITNLDYIGEVEVVDNYGWATDYTEQFITLMIKDPYCDDGHKWGEWYDVTEVDCTTDGSASHDCEYCGETETVTEEAHGHEYEDVVTAPTPESQGYTTHTCKHCGDTYVDSYTDFVDPGNSDTGDSFNALLWTMALTASLAGLAYVLTAGKKYAR